MPYLLVKDFQRGLDVRRMVENVPAGALIRCENAHITRGGEVEKRLAFVNRFVLTGNSFGWFAFRGTYYAFGSDDQPAGWPAGVNYQKLVEPGASPSAMTRVWDVEVWADKLYVAAEFASGKVFHYYDGAVVGSPGDPAKTTPAGRQCLTHNNKMYTVESETTTLRFSMVGDPTKWEAGTDTGAGFIDLSTQARGARQLLGMAEYYTNVGVFAERDVLIWSLDEDPALNVLIQVLRNTGSITGRAITQFGDSDVFYLDISGVRSLKARDSSNAAFVSDVGTPIDRIIQAKLASSDANRVTYAQGLVESTDGRFWLAVDNVIYVFTFFPSAKIQAWSTYVPKLDNPGDNGFITDIIADGPDVWMRSGNNVYQYGGEDKNVYDDAPVVVQLPFLSNDKPATKKIVKGLDISCEGLWKVELLNDPFLTTASMAGNVNNSTYNLPQFGVAQWGNHISVRLTNSTAQPARIGNIAIHFDEGEQS